MSRMVFGKFSLFVIFFCCFVLCVLSFVGGIAVGLPANASDSVGNAAGNGEAVGSITPNPTGEGGRARQEAGASLGLAAGRQVAKPVDLLSSLVQRKITTGGGALPGGAVAANALNAEVSRQSREADRTVEAVNDGVRNSVTGKSDTAGPIPTSKVAAANPAPTLFTLELGAFHTAADAQAFARNVGARGYPVEIVEEASNDGGTVSRVRSGHFSDRTLAADMQKKLEDTAGLGATIVQASSAHPG